MLWRGRPDRFWTTESNEKLNLERVGGEVGGLDKGEIGLGGVEGSDDDDAACVCAVGFNVIRSDKQNESIGCEESNKQVPVYQSPSKRK